MLQTIWILNSGPLQIMTNNKSKKPNGNVKVTKSCTEKVPKTMLYRTQENHSIRLISCMYGYNQLSLFLIRPSSIVVISVNISTQNKHTVRGKKSRTASPLAEATVDKTLVSSMPKTAAPLANRAILPVSNVIKRDPISNSSLKVSRTLVRAATVVSGSSCCWDWEAKPMRPQQMVRKPRLLHVRKWGMEEKSGFALEAMDAMATERERVQRV